MDWRNNTSCKKLVCYSGFLRGDPPTKKDSGPLPCFIYQSQAGCFALWRWNFPGFRMKRPTVSLGGFWGVLGHGGKMGSFHLSFGSWSTTSQHSGSGMICWKLGIVQDSSCNEAKVVAMAKPLESTPTPDLFFGWIFLEDHWAKSKGN